MIVFISPAKTFKSYQQEGLQIPTMVDFSKKILKKLQILSADDLKTLMKVNDKIALLNYDRFKNFKFDKKGSPAIFSYDGIQYKSINPSSFNNDDIDFAQNNIRILSGLYGVLSPMDSIYPYRLEMMTKLEISPFKNLYEFWDDSIYSSLNSDSDGVIVNLASDEYSKSVKKYLDSDTKYITCIFKIEKNDKLKVESTASKKARGLMVNYIVKNKISDYHKLKDFNLDGFEFSEDLSTFGEQKIEYIFIKKAEK
ncbi:peroxide stress protein YaaA [Peptostreptococcus faecalis]|uniref:peroxide stress protein YaaA n=1 Tax=Peptostreptococcus faecalis TaxID=2045015 RepID=UPI000C7B3E58|nr:peroxide stress protein YaaA [Peptostreptococcus faecalis]